ncbi:STAS/SEC14 domain-containing protein [uncultured Pseudodesulfovibrio sp.]|uniref:STAS/SEC14 domain-containing protein n=1 Tax=uncultured Pseudodesulfovibrio sp. TaxID=2035858 RepID=UPI0029C85F05|nr:STAS/SEC14 domain-containing protein [uncultured Pseudodesulfovibrio sp.]
MITIMEQSSDRMLAVRATGKLTDLDYSDIWIPALEKIIAEYGRADALLFMEPDFQGWEPRALWDDARFGLAHRKEFRKLAVVGGPAWVRWGVKLGELLMDCEVKLYPTEKLDQALEWGSS